MNSCYFERIFPLKSLQYENTLTFTVYLSIQNFVSLIKRYTATESKIHVKSCKIDGKPTLEFKGR